MLSNFISFDSGFASSTLSYAGMIVSDFSVPITVIIGVSIGITIILLLIKMLRS